LASNSATARCAISSSRVGGSGCAAFSSSRTVEASAMGSN
jgi:hypothetical protein